MIKHPSISFCMKAEYFYKQEACGVITHRESVDPHYEIFVDTTHIKRPWKSLANMQDFPRKVGQRKQVLN